MKTTLKTGISASRTYPVDAGRTIDFMGEDARVYATPMLVRDIEVTCRDLLAAHIEPGEDSVGTRVEIDHPRGVEVRLERVPVPGEHEDLEVFRGGAGGQSVARGVGRGAAWICARMPGRRCSWHSGWWPGSSSSALPRSPYDT